jgi:hypothetical protein
MLLDDQFDRCLLMAGESGNVDLAHLRRTLKLWIRFGN